MKSVIASVLFILCFSNIANADDNIGKENKKKIVGTWCSVVDPGFGGIAVKFNKNGTCILFAEKLIQGTYDIRGNELVITSTNGQQDTMKGIIRWIGPYLVLEDKDKKILTLRREKE